MKKVNNSLQEKLIGFIQYCRERQFTITPQQSTEAFSLVQLGLILDRNQFKYGLKSLFCNSQGQTDRFEEMFDRFWSRAYVPQLEEQKVQKTPKKRQKVKSSLVWLGGTNNQLGKKESSKETKGANEAIRLRKTDFSKLQLQDVENLERLSEELFHQMSQRYKRRLDYANSGAVDIRKTIRHSIPKGGLLLDLSFRKKKKEKRKLVILLDISGSMDTYSYYLLRFVMVLKTYFKELEFFTFSTSLKRITALISKKTTAEVFEGISEGVEDWSGGTKIGESLSDFVSNYGNKLLTQKHVIVILSDGLETGNLAVLKKAVSDIKLRSKMLVWLNPLKGMKGFQPIQKGMVSALPHIDVFESAHNLDSLLKLEKILADV